VIASIVHQLSPMAIEISPGVGVRWYGLSYLLGFLCGWLLLRTLAQRGRILLSTAQVADLMTYIIIGVVAGGRLGHVLFYEPRLLVTFHEALPWWGLLDIHKGGMASHGGIIGTVVAGVLFARRRGISVAHVIDCMAFSAPPGLCFGRLANWVNGELWGKALPASMQANPPWWSVKYPQEVLEPNFPVQSLQPLASLVDPSQPLPTAIVDAAYNHRADVIVRLEPLLTAYWPNNFIQAATDGPLLLGVLTLVWLRPRRPGVIAGAFLVTYGAARLFSEQLRQADDGVFAVGVFTLPMLLSIGMMLLGAAVLWRIGRSNAPRIGGLLSLSGRTQEPSSPTPAPKA